MLDRLVRHTPSGSELSFRRQPGRYTEYLAHEASVIPLSDRPLRSNEIEHAKNVSAGGGW